MKQMLIFNSRNVIIIYVFIYFNYYYYSIILIPCNVLNVIT